MTEPRETIASDQWKRGARPEFLRGRLPAPARAGIRSANMTELLLRLHPTQPPAPFAARIPAGKEDNPQGAARRRPLCQAAVHRNNKKESLWLLRRTSYQISQNHTHLLRRAKQTILSSLFAGAEHFSDHTQPQSLVVPELKNHALARRKVL